MSNTTAFYLWKGERQALIERHLFYFNQAKKRLLSHWTDIEGEANAFADNWIKEHEQYFDPTRHNHLEFEKQATEEAQGFYLLLSDMKKSAELSVLAGMYHEWDKQLREWLSKEFREWYQGRHVLSKLWSSNFDQIIDLVKIMILRSDSIDYLDKLDACQLVVNVYKHGDGRSFEQLKANYPEYIRNTFPEFDNDTAFGDLRHYSDVEVNDSQLDEFSNAIIAFWKGIPERVMLSQIKQVPNWLEKAIQKDEREKTHD